MPMFDDPKKELERMQKVLLEDEELNGPNQEDSFESELADIKAWLNMDDDDASNYQKYVEDFRKQQGKGGVRADYQDMEQEDDRKAKDDARGQQILTFLLLSGILAVIGYWVTILL